MEYNILDVRDRHDIEIRFGKGSQYVGSVAIEWRLYKDQSFAKTYNQEILKTINSQLENSIESFEDPVFVVSEYLGLRLKHD